MGKEGEEDSEKLSSLMRRHEMRDDEMMRKVKSYYTGHA